MKVLITGGAGYIGSHTVLQVLSAGHDVKVVDDFSNSTPIVFDRLKLLSGQVIDHEVVNLTSLSTLTRVFKKFNPDIVIHFAGLKSVAESSTLPLKYYYENVYGSLNLLKAMDAANCSNLVFSSSATVYGEAKYLPYDEHHPINPTNVYGRTKAFIESIITDWSNSKNESSAVILRYFNPVGADKSTLIGESPLGRPNNLLPIITKVAVGALPQLTIHGNDYPTRDGSGERDYVHVEDLAKAHVDALVFATTNKGVETFNIGTGKGATVFEILQTFQEMLGVEIPYEIGSRRSGDVARSVGAVEKARKILHWSADHDLLEMCRSALLWQQENPNGYE